MSRCPASRVAKVIRSGGGVNIYHRPAAHSKLAAQDFTRLEIPILADSGRNGCHISVDVHFIKELPPQSIDRDRQGFAGHEQALGRRR